MSETEPCKKRDNRWRLVEEKDIPGKGRGIVARRSLAMGTMVIKERPILTAQIPGNDDYTYRPVAAETVEMLLFGTSKEEQRVFFGLHSPVSGGCPLSNIYNYNFIRLSPQESEDEYDKLPNQGIFEVLSKVNHACVPNTEMVFDYSSGCGCLYAVRNIEANEEITFSYLENLHPPTFQPGEIRQELLAIERKFDCKCTTCTLPFEERLLSDERHRKAGILRAFVADPHHVAEAPKKCLHYCRLLMETMMEEGIRDKRLAMCWEVGFDICIRNSDVARATVFGEMAYKRYKLVNGAKGVKTVMMKTAMDAPMTWKGAGETKRWLSSDLDLPPVFVSKISIDSLWGEDGPREVVPCKIRIVSYDDGGRDRNGKEEEEKDESESKRRRSATE